MQTPYKQCALIIWCGDKRALAADCLRPEGIMTGLEGQQIMFAAQEA